MHHILYEIDPELTPSLPDGNEKNDAMYNVSNEFTMIQVCMENIENRRRKATLPRMFWVKKTWTMQELHKYVFKKCRFWLSDWADATDPASKRINEDPKLKGICQFPYKKDKDVPMTKADFDAMSNDEAYELCFPKHKVSSNEIEPTDLDFDVAEMPYALEFRSTSSYSRKHKFEGNKVPYSSE